MARSGRNTKHTVNRTEGHTMTWEELLGRNDIVGGDLESHESGDVYRGPIESVKREGDIVTFKLTWVATMTPGVTEWHKSPVNIREAHVDTKLVTLQDFGNGRYGYHVPFMGPVVFFPKGGSKLDPDRVRGLDTRPVAQA